MLIFTGTDQLPNNVSFITINISLNHLTDYNNASSPEYEYNCNHQCPSARILLMHV